MLELIALAIACWWTRQAIAVLFLHVVTMMLAHWFLDAGALYFLAVSSLYAVAAASNINFLSRIRWALYTIGVINWWAAIDFLAWPDVTLFYQLYPYITNGVDVAVLLMLWGQRGKSVVGRFFAVGHGGALPMASCSLRHRDPKED